jgi:hypothetical protein
MNRRQIHRRRQQDAVAAGLAMQQLARVADRAGDLVRAIAWARAAVRAFACDRILAGEAERHLSRLIDRHEHEGGHAA